MMPSPRLSAVVLACVYGIVSASAEPAVDPCSILAHGAVGDNATDSTAALQTTLDACHAAHPGGATVTVPPGTFRLTHSIALTSNTTLRLSHGATLFSAQTPDSQPPPLTPRCDTSYWKSTAIFCGANVSNVAIVGSSPHTSVLDGGGWPWYLAKLFGKGPRLFEPTWCSNVTLQAVGLVNSPSWTVHPQYCSGVVASNIRIENPRFTPNTDGFDPDSCVDCLLENSFIDTGDDGISVKSSNSSRDSRVMMPTRGLVVRNTTVLSRNVCVGSATFGGVYDVLMENMTIGDDDGSSPWAIKYKSHRYYPGPMVNHTYRDIRIGKIAPNTWQQPDGGTAFIVSLNYGDKPPADPPACPPSCPLFEDVKFENITVAGAVHAGSIVGYPHDQLHRLVFHNVTFLTPPTESGWTCNNVASYKAVDVTPPLSCK